MTKKTKKLLLTGASGFIGRHTIPHLQSQGYEVHVTTQNESAGRHATHLSHKCNLLNAGEVQRLMAELRPTHLLHLAWYVEPGLFWRSTENLKWVAASLELIRLFKEMGGKRALFAGTCTEYDWGHEFLSEKTTPLSPSNLYGTCKNSLQQIYTDFAKQEGLSAAWGRIFFQYGPFEKESRLVPSVIVAILTETATALSHGKQIRNYMHVEDVARAFVHVLESDFEGPINIASKSPCEIREIVSIIIGIIGGAEWIKMGERAAPPNEPLRIQADPALLYHVLGFTEKFTLEEGLDDTVRWWKAQIQSR